MVSPCTTLLAAVAAANAVRFNVVELLGTIFLTFRTWSGKYFYCLVVATVGTLVYEINVFMMIFAPHLNAHGIIACIGIGWSAMVTGQSLVLWSRLHLVCRSTWKLRIILGMIIINGVSMHGPQFVFSLLVRFATFMIGCFTECFGQAVKNNAIDPTYKPFEIMEKIAVSILTTQEVIISMVYLIATVRILRIGESVQRKGNRRRIKMLFLANVAIICIDVCTITLEFLALWGVWCGFKGFGYSVKLKIEFAILNQLRDSVKGSSNTESYDMQNSSKGIGLSLRSRQEQNVKSAHHPSGLSNKRHTFEQISEAGHIQKTTEIDVRRDEHAVKIDRGQPRDAYVDRTGAKTSFSESSSEIEFANRGV